VGRPSRDVRIEYTVIGTGETGSITRSSVQKSWELVKGSEDVSLQKLSNPRAGKSKFAGRVFVSKLRGNVFKILGVTVYDDESGNPRRVLSAIYSDSYSKDISDHVFGFKVHHLNESSARGANEFGTAGADESLDNRKFQETTFIDAHFYKKVVSSAEERNIPMELSIEGINRKMHYYVMKDGFLMCQHCGMELSRKVKSNIGQHNVMSIDRIFSKPSQNSDFGYTFTNIQPLCAMCNRMKGDSLDSEVLEHHKKVALFLERQGEQMRKIKITEAFYSVQGEGRRVGVPSVFVRVFGCNLNCPGFGQPRGNMIPIEEMPHNTFDVSQVESIEDLPVFNFGCDSSAAWSKRYRHLSEDFTVDELNNRIQSYFTDADMWNTPDLVITGGEPLLKKYQKFWVEFFAGTNFQMDLTFETNGTQTLLPEFVQALRDYTTNGRGKVTFSVSPKLSISGEPFQKAIVAEAVDQYVVELYDWSPEDFDVYLKFVIRDEQDIEEVEKVEATYTNFIGDIYLMPEGATIEGLKLTERGVAELAMRHGYFFSPRLHCHLFGNSWST